LAEWEAVKEGEDEEEIEVYLVEEKRGDSREGQRGS